MENPTLKSPPTPLCKGGQGGFLGDLFRRTNIYLESAEALQKVYP